ncbi:MAG TPA: PH domain-containing protein [Streptosporangiaceae bacterium]|nr:PH domain-containing protein [Streptosporangiaceae bacterium]
MSVGTPRARETYRKRMPVVIWWVWLAFAAVNAADLAIQWHHRSSIVIAAVLALCTGVAYACALRPRVIADETGITVLNPVRDAAVPWGVVKAVDVGEAVQVHFSLPDGTEKVFPSWAMFSSSRAQLKADIRSRRQAAELSKLSPTYSRLPAEAKETMTRTEAQLVADALDRRARSVRKAGAPAGQASLSWAWWPIAAMVLPAIAAIVLVLT